MFLIKDDLSETEESEPATQSGCQTQIVDLIGEYILQSGNKIEGLVLVKELVVIFDRSHRSARQGKRFKTHLPIGSHLDEYDLVALVIGDVRVQIGHSGMVVVGERFAARRHIAAQPVNPQTGNLQAIQNGM